MIALPVMKMRKFLVILLLVLALNWICCSPSTTEVPGTSSTRSSCVTEQENTAEITQQPCFESEGDKRPVSSSESSSTSPDVTSPHSSSANEQSRITSKYEQEGSSHYTLYQSKTTESFRQTNAFTANNPLLQSTNYTHTSTKASDDSFNNVSADDHTVLADTFKSSTKTPEAEKDTVTQFATVMMTSSTFSSAEEQRRNDYTSKVKPEEELISLLLNVTAPYCHESVCKESASSAVHCYCDDLCYFYNDCCYSMIEKLVQAKDYGTHQLAYLIQEKVRDIENKTIMLRKDLTACVGNVYNKSAFIMVSGCDRDKHSPENIRDNCELSAEWYGVQNVPVDHVQDNKVMATFKNIYCALCNAVPQSEIVFWNINITCPENIAETAMEMELEEIALLEECWLQPYSMFTNSIRKCLKGDKTLGNCDKTEMIDLCNAYNYPLTDVIDTGRNAPHLNKNPHCAACTSDKLNVSNFFCGVTKHKPFHPGSIVKFVDLQLIFDFSLEKGIVSNVKCVSQEICKTYEIYDCASKRCRQLYCQAGETPFKGKCVEVQVSGVAAGNVVVETLKPVDKFDNLTNGGETFILELLSDDDADLVFKALYTTFEHILQTIYETIERSMKIMKIEKMRECFCIKSIISAGVVDVFTDLFPKLILFFDELEEREKRGFSLIPLFTKIRNFQELNSLECSTGTLIVETNPSVVKANSAATSSNNSSIALWLPSSEMTVYEHNSLWEIGYDKRIGVFPSMVATCFISDNRPNLNCSMLAYEFNEIDISNTSMKIINTSLIFDEGDFIIFQNKVFICADKITRTNTVLNIFAFSAHRRILSLVTSLVSVISAAVVVLAHCCLKRLRNIHGLNLSALSLSTVFMHLLLIVQPLIASKTTCLVYSIALHFVLLNIFVWMNIIGYDMTRIFMSNKIILESSPVKRFLRYLFLSLVIPTVIVTSAVSLDFTDSAFKPNYGDEVVCWLTNGKSVIMFVTGPVVISMLLNFSFFTFTVKAIYSKAKQTKFARNRSYFVVYLKLTLILGLTWIVGIIGAFAEQEWLWIVHLTLNGLQGLSLLICSVVNVRNIRRLRTSLKNSATENSNL